MRLEQIELLKKVHMWLKVEQKFICLGPDSKKEKDVMYLSFMKLKIGRGK